MIKRKARTAYMFWLVVTLYIAYPLSELTTLTRILYSAVYCLLLGLGTLIYSENRRYVVVAGLIAAATILISLPWILIPENHWIALGNYIGFTSLNLFIVFTLVNFLFSAKVVNRDVLYAAATLYIMIANTFIPFYMCIEVGTQISTQASAFAMNAGGPVTWQRMAYFSLVTLTTLGYGDIVPVTGLSQMVTSMEAVTGTLYITFLIGRLVGLYAGEDGED
ncbi:MAG: potassium channel family protein [Anaerolineae bacterium]